MKQLNPLKSLTAFWGLRCLVNWLDVKMANTNWYKLGTGTKEAKRMKPEAQFEKDLATYARMINCVYIKIPDTNMLNKTNRHRNREQKRPFDGILVTNHKNYCIECKIDSGHLLPHQESNQQGINKLNGTFYVLRKRRRKKSVAYQIEFNGELVEEFDNILDMIGYFQNLKEY